MILNKIKKSACLMLIISSIVLVGTPFAFAEGDTTSTTEEPKSINLVEFRELFIEDSADIRKINDYKDQINDALYEFEKNKKLIFYFGEQLSYGYKEDRKGIYYDYYDKYFVKIENANAQLDSLDIMKEVAEAKLSFGADQLLTGRGLLQEKINLYNKMIERTEITYKATEEKKAQGVLSQFDLDYAKVELENIKLNRDKLVNELDSLEARIISMTNLDSEKEYKFQTPVFTAYRFEDMSLSDYYESALSTNLALANANRQMEALEYEEKFIKVYERYVLKSDSLDFDQRMADGKSAIVDAKRDIYKYLVDNLNEYNRISDDINVINLQIKYDQNMLDKLALMEELGQVIDTDRLGYQLKLFQSDLQKMSLENDRLLIGQKIQTLMSSGIDL